MAVIKRRDRSGVEECQTMQLSECIRDVILLTINLTNPVHWRGYLPSIVLNPIQTAPTKPVAMMVITALNV